MGKGLKERKSVHRAPYRNGPSLLRGWATQSVNCNIGAVLENSFDESGHRCSGWSRWSGRHGRGS